MVFIRGKATEKPFIRINYSELVANNHPLSSAVKDMAKPSTEVPRSESLENH